MKMIMRCSTVKDHCDFDFFSNDLISSFWMFMDSQTPMGLLKVIRESQQVEIFFSSILVPSVG